MSEKKSILHSSVFQTFAAMILGAACGLAFGDTMSQFKFIGTIWLNSLKMILVPMIFCSMTLAVGGQSNMRTLGRIALRIFVYYMLTTAVAAAIGYGVGAVIRPGEGMSLEGFASSKISANAAGFTFTAFFTNLFSSGFFTTLSKGNMMQTIVIAVMMGSALVCMKEERRKPIIGGLQLINEWIGMYLKGVIKLAPVGVFFLLAESFGKFGAVLLTSMFSLIATYWIAVLFHILFVYGGILLLTVGISPVRFLKDSMQVWTFTVATCSSAANMPNNIDCAEKKFGVPSYISKFCIPLGANMNCDGSAILYGCVVIFMSNLYGFTLAPMELVKFILVATLVSSSGGGIPGANLVKLMVVLETFGWPVEIVGIIAGFYRMFDMASTTGNCMGDLAGTIAVAGWEKKRAKRLGISLEEELHL